MSSALQGELGLRACLAADTTSVRVDLEISEFEAVGTVIITEDGLGIPRESVNAALLDFPDRGRGTGTGLWNMRSSWDFLCRLLLLALGGGASYDR